MALDEESLQESLILHEEDGSNSKTVALLNVVVKNGMKLVMWVIFITWAGFMFYFPSDFVFQLFNYGILATEGTVFGTAGSLFLMFTAPVLVITLLGTIYVALFPIDYSKKKRRRSASIRLWTFPILVDGPFGVVTASELTGIVLFAAFIIWAVSVYVTKDVKIAFGMDFISLKEKLCFMLDLMGFHLGIVGLFCIVFLFLPISRGSILLRMIDIPFEHATRYHVWLGHATMVVFTLHGLSFFVSWTIQGNLLYKIIQWQSSGVAYLAGVISLLSGLLMWVTSFQPVRRKYFELFFYTHQLYAVFIIFFAMHVGDFVFYMAGGGIFLFLLDRFLRFCQSRPKVDVVSAKCLPCGTLELTISKPQNLSYNALSFVFLQVRTLSWLEWHPFSVSSSPLDGGLHLSVLIKVLGDWTKKLRDSILDAQRGDFKIAASVEGPYGHESPYYLQYEHLILVAGGIGVSPFIAIIRDILHRYNEKRPCLPKKILLVWSVKRSTELSLVGMINASSIHPFFSKDLDLVVQKYVTQEPEPPLEDGKPGLGNKTIVALPESSCRRMSGLVGTGNSIWFGLYVLASTLGFIVLVALVKQYYKKGTLINSSWDQGLWGILCMVASVVICGGPVILLWNQWERQAIDHRSEIGHEGKDKESMYVDRIATVVDVNQDDASEYGPTVYGQRPDFKEIFGSMSHKWGNVDVGVLVCGPPGLQTSVAAACRSQNFKRQHNHPVFHFHSHSFDL